MLRVGANDRRTRPRPGAGGFCLSERILSLPAYVASVAPRDLADAARLAGAAPPEANAIEYRLDLSRADIPAERLLALDGRPAIVTYRTRSEGGEFDGAPDDYRRLAAKAYAAGATVDVEHASGLLDDPGVFPDRSRVIVSHHAPFGLPEDWRDRLEAMRGTRARAAKLVVGAAELAPSLQAAQIQRAAGNGTAIFPMGPASAPGRILAALFGSCLVYGPVEAPTAAGQVPLSELLGVYRVHEERPIEALFGILGTDVSGSLSPMLHNALFGSRQLPFLYLPLPVSDFRRAHPLALESDPPFRGFSVTHPWKVAAASAAVPSPDVRDTGAANTLHRRRDRWRAENTDVDGIFDPLADHETGEGRTAVILGAGGVARAAVVACRRLGYEVTVAARRGGEADRLGEALRVDSVAWEDVGATEADLYVNATPLGAREDDPPAVPAEALEHRPLVFDCVYRKDGSPTATVRAARAALCPVVEGIRMFAAQAVRQARLFGVSDARDDEVSRILAGGTR
jgi:3-dehydroquinate dehydratase/shikimate dehydrogenase